MYEVTAVAGLIPMSDETRGHAIKRRRLAFGITSQDEFAKATGVSRGAIQRAEAGDPTTRDSTYVRLESWLDKFAEETGSEADDAAAAEPDHGNGGQITFKASGVFGIDELIVDSSPEVADEARRQFVELIQEIRRAQGPGQSS